MRVFSLCPHYTIMFGAFAVVPWLDWGGPLDGLFRRFADLHTVHKCTSRCSVAFSFVFDFARSPTDAKPPDELSLRALPAGASRYAPAVSLQPSSVGLACLQDVMHVFDGSAHLSSLRSPLASSKSSPATWSPLTLGCPVALLVLRLDKASGLPNPVLRHCVQYVPVA